MKVPTKTYVVVWNQKTRKHVVVNNKATFWGGVTRETAVAVAKKRNAVEREIAKKLKTTPVEHKEMAL